MMDAVLQQRLAWALFVLLLSTLACCQPNDLMMGFFVSYIVLLPPPPQAFLTAVMQTSARRFELPLDKMQVVTEVGEMTIIYCYKFVPLRQYSSLK